MNPNFIFLSFDKNFATKKKYKPKDKISLC